MKVTKRIHHIWREYEYFKDKIPVPYDPIIGKYQYIYESQKGKISLVELPDYFRNGITLWEIYSLKGQLFSDIERYTSKEEAEKRIKELLD